MSENVANPATVTAEHDGRTLSGSDGVSLDRLQETMERRAVEPEPTPPQTTVEPAQAPIPTDTQPKPTRGQARFAELTQQRKDAESRAEALQKELDDFRARAAQYQQAPAAPGHSPPAAVTPAGPVPGDTGQPTRPEPTEAEVGEKYGTYGEFVKDHGLWVWEQQQPRIGDLVRQGIEQHQAQQAFMAHVESTRAKGRTAYKDFDAMLQGGPGASVNMPQEAIRAIYNLPNSEHVQYAIMKDGALANELAGLAARDPYAFAFKLASIAPAAPAVSTASTGYVGSATPPPPMQPVGSGSKTTSLSSAEHAKLGNYAAYKAARAAERGGNRRR